MSEQVFSQLTHTTPDNAVTRLYFISAALEHLALTLPEQQDGLALLIGRMGSDVQCCAILLDDSEQDE